MGKNSQPKNSNGHINDKTNPSIKWARTLHLLDYHRWHHVKNMMANKKHSEKKKDSGTSPADQYVHEPHACDKKEFVEKPSVEQQSNDPGNLAKNSTLPPSPKSKSSGAAKKIKKLIVKEVTKRRGRHRRSSTCPVNTGFTTNDEPTHQHSQHVGEGVGDLSNNERGKSTTNCKDEGENRECGLCNTMQIDCQLSDERGEKVKEHGDLPLDQLNMFLHEMPPYDENNQTSNENNIVERNASFQHYSRDFFDVIDVLSLNKQFFLRVLDDPDSSLRHHFLTQQSAPSTSKRKPLSKFGTFPATHPSSIDNESSSPNLLKHKHASFKVNSSRSPTLSEKPSSSHDNQMLGTRLKSLSKKESRRIAMDAVCHKVPYGQNSQEESTTTKGSPCVSSCGSNNFSSHSSHKNGKKSFKRSPSLEGSMDKYSQLFRTTGSFNRSPCKLEAPDRSPRLKVKNENSSKKALERNFSLPDLQVSLYQKSSDYEGCGYYHSRTPNRHVLSFNERGTNEGGFNMGSELGRKMEDRIIGGNVRKEELEENVKNEVNMTEDTSNKVFETILDALEDASSDDNGSMTDSQCNEIMNMESNPTMMNESDGQISLSGDDELKLEDAESSKEDAESQDSPTFACIKVDEDEVEWLTEPPSPTLHTLKVSSKDKAEFNYVRDILQLSGYSGSQLLGSWYSSGQPVDPSVFVELESCSFMEPISYLRSKEGNNNSNRLLLFDLINEVLTSIYERSISYWPHPLSSCSRTHPMPKGYRVLEEVWTCINWYLACSKEGLGSNLDYIVVRDLAKDEWENLQVDAEYVGLEVEEFIFDDLLTELVT